jgi:hypothetical protein
MFFNLLINKKKVGDIMIKVWNEEINVLVNLINFEEALKFIEINQDWLVLETIDNI